MSMRPLRVAAVLLAAGRARRMGGPNKLLLEVDGVPMVRRAWQALRGAEVAPIVVVLGREAEAVAAALPEHAPSGFVRVAPELEQAHSVELGLRSLPQGPDLVLIALGDQPLIDADDVRWLIEQWRRFGDANPRDTIAIVPWRGAQRGNPVAIDARALPGILAAWPLMSCRRYLDAHPEQVVGVQAPNDHFVIDIDTPDDLAKLMQETSR